MSEYDLARRPEARMPPRHCRQLATRAAERPSDRASTDRSTGDRTSCAGYSTGTTRDRLARSASRRSNVISFVSPPGKVIRIADEQQRRAIQPELEPRQPFQDLLPFRHHRDEIRAGPVVGLAGARPGSGCAARRASCPRSTSESCAASAPMSFTLRMFADGQDDRHPIAVDEHDARHRDPYTAARRARGARRHRSTRDQRPRQERRGRGLDERGGEGLEAGVLLLPASVQLVEEIARGRAGACDVPARDLHGRDEREDDGSPHSARAFEPSRSGMVTYAS